MADQAAYDTASRALLAKTGKDLEAWVAVARASGVGPHMALVRHLKDTHGLGHGHANTIAHAANASAAASIADDDLMDAMFAGPKAAMRPVYDAVLAALAGLDGVELAPKKGYVSLRRSKQFATAQPSTGGRFDLGLNLKGEPANGRLEAAGSWNAMVTHRVRIGSATEVDAEVAGWLRAAYDRA
jgi:hypothetical protein